MLSLEFAAEEVTLNSRFSVLHDITDGTGVPTLVLCFLDFSPLSLPAPGQAFGQEGPLKFGRGKAMLFEVTWAQVRQMHGCCWATFCRLAYCGYCGLVVGIPT